MLTKQQWRALSVTMRERELDDLNVLRYLPEKTPRLEGTREKLGYKHNARPLTVTARLLEAKRNYPARIISNTKDAGHMVFVPPTVDHAAYGGKVIRDRPQAIDNLPDHDIIGYRRPTRDKIGCVNMWE